MTLPLGEKSEAFDTPFVQGFSKTIGFDCRLLQANEAATQNLNVDCENKHEHSCLMRFPKAK
jgi:hypothetical protein